MASTPPPPLAPDISHHREVTLPINYSVNIDRPLQTLLGPPPSTPSCQKYENSGTPYKGFERERERERPDQETERENKRPDRETERPRERKR